MDNQPPVPPAPIQPVQSPIGAPLPSQGSQTTQQNVSAHPLGDQHPPSPSPTTPIASDVPGPKPVVASAKKKSPMLGILVLLLIVISGSGGLIYWARTQANESKNVTAIVTIANTNPVLDKELMLSLESPSQGSLAVNSETLVKGKTLPNTVVAIFTDTDESTIESDANGNFETTVLLSPGINSLSVTAYGEDGEEKNVSVDLVYDSQT